MREEIEPSKSAENQAKLWEAARYGSAGGVKFFLKRVEDVDALDAQGWTALRWAVRKPALECARLLLEAGANPSKADGVGDSPLHEAARMGHLDIQRLLIKAGANMKAKNGQGLTPIDLANLRSSGAKA